MSKRKRIKLDVSSTTNSIGGHNAGGHNAGGHNAGGHNSLKPMICSHMTKCACCYLHFMTKQHLEVQNAQLRERIKLLEYKLSQKTNNTKSEVVDSMDEEDAETVPVTTETVPVTTETVPDNTFPSDDDSGCPSYIA